MQYYIHSHHSGTDNKECLAILVKGLHKIDIGPPSRDAWAPVLPPIRPDNTRINRRPNHPFAQPIPGRFQPPLPGRSSAWPATVRPAPDPNSARWHLVNSGQRVSLSPNITVQCVSEMGGNRRDYFVFPDLQMAHVDLTSKQVRWTIFSNLAEIHYFKHGNYNFRNDGVSDVDQLIKAIKYSADYMPAASRERVREFLTPESLAIMATFGGLYVVAQLTPVGWVADAIVAVTFIGGCVLMGPELIAIAQLLNQFYDTATQAGSNEGQYRKAGKYFADAVSKIGFDVLLGILLHKASVPLKRKWVNYRQSLGGGEVRAGVVEEPVGIILPKTWTGRIT